MVVVVGPVDRYRRRSDTPVVVLSWCWGRVVRVVRLRLVIVVVVVLQLDDCRGRRGRSMRGSVPAVVVAGVVMFQSVSLLRIE